MAQQSDVTTLLEIGTEIRKLQISVAILKSAIVSLAVASTPVQQPLPALLEKAGTFLVFLQETERGYVSSDQQVKELEIVARALRAWKIGES